MSKSHSQVRINPHAADGEERTPLDHHCGDEDVADATAAQADETLSNTSSRFNNVSIYENKDGDVEIIVEKDQPVIFTILEAANIDGVQHLSSANACTRYTWFLLITIFVCMCFYQIATQAMMYWLTPIATNIAAAYPASVPFPVVAICNNNRYRLTYLTGATIQNRRPKGNFTPFDGEPPDNGTELNVFDKALRNTWDMEAVRFLKSAAHWRSRMILRCQWPNGTRCRTSDFRPIWTLTGVCWAINSDPMNPVHVTGAGLGNSLNLLLNVERYERIESCTPHFRTESLPGIKVLIYNQTDVPTSSIEGVNVPPGFTMDIPFRMQHRQKLSGRDCVDQLWHADGTLPDFDSSLNVKACVLKSYLDKIESHCNCSMRSVHNSTERLKPCDVRTYFGCVTKVLFWGYDNGFVNFAKCPASCDEIDYTAWQDMNELPNNIFPKLIDAVDDDDDDDEEEEEEYAAEADSLHYAENEDEAAAGGSGTRRFDLIDDDVELYKCEHNQILDDVVVSRIKREAHRAYEKQARYQEDILLRTSRLINRVRHTTNRIRALKWGWHSEHFDGIPERLRRSVPCYANMTARHANVFDAIGSPQSHGEERRAQQLHQLLNPYHFRSSPGQFKTIGDVRRVYGDAAEEKWRKALRVEDVLHRLFLLFDEDTFNRKLPKSLELMDKVLQLMEQYAAGQLQRRAWAEKMMSRNMKHFLNEDCYESWYNLVVKELEQVILKTVGYVEEVFPHANGSSTPQISELDKAIGSVLLFNDLNHRQVFEAFMEDIIDCTLNEVRNHTLRMLDEFKRVMQDFQSAAQNLFGKELPDYLENFEFGPKFVQENFAQVNVFLHKMNVEHWLQEPTYSVWSLLCDIGGALGLFLGASLLTIIEVAYFIMHTKIYRKLRFWRSDNDDDDDDVESPRNEKEISPRFRKPTVIRVLPRRRYYSFHDIEPESVSKGRGPYSTRTDSIRNRQWKIGRPLKRSSPSKSKSSGSYQSVIDELAPMQMSCYNDSSCNNEAENDAESGRPNNGGDFKRRGGLNDTARKASMRSKQGHSGRETAPSPEALKKQDVGKLCNPPPPPVAQNVPPPLLRRKFGSWDAKGGAEPQTNNNNNNNSVKLSEQPPPIPPRRRILPPTTVQPRPQNASGHPSPLTSTPLSTTQESTSPSTVAARPPSDNENQSLSLNLDPKNPLQPYVDEPKPIIPPRGVGDHPKQANRFETLNHGVQLSNPKSEGDPLLPISVVSDSNAFLPSSSISSSESNRLSNDDKEPNDSKTMEKQTDV